MRQRLTKIYAQLKMGAPAICFVGGFLWDALTLGKRVGPQDFGILGLYGLIAAALLWWMAKDRHHPEPLPLDPESTKPLAYWLPWLRFNGPYLVLQFLFGGLFSALFIFYFKSAGHLSALTLAMALGGLLVGNEFLGKHYRRRFTLTWALFGFSAMLLLNFALPHAFGSLNPGWFYLSTLLGAGLAHGLRQYAPGQPGRIYPVWLLAGTLALANLGDFIPPVPLVEKDLLLGTAFEKSEGRFTLMVEKAPWWIFWRENSKTLHLAENDKLYCLAAVFAPKGLSTQLTHRWELQDRLGQWHLVSQTRFPINGGRENGFRGYSFKQSPAPGHWRVALQSETGRTLSIHEFTVEITPADPELLERKGL